MPPTLPSGTVTFLYTDIEGSTPLWERDPAAMRASVAQHHGILRAAIDANDGLVFKIVGNSFQSAFALAAHAVEAAVAAPTRSAAGWAATLILTSMPGRGIPATGPNTTEVRRPLQNCKEQNQQARARILARA